MPERVTIDHIGAKGDGVVKDANGVLYVPYAAPGDDLEVKIQGKQGRIKHIHKASPDRAEPICKHFGRCGGCSLQHVNADYYGQWKKEQVRTALAHRGFENVDVADPVISAVGSRRRARFNVVGRGKDVAVVGFSERLSHNLIDIQECPVLMPKIADFIGPLRAFLGRQLNLRDKMAVQVNCADNGLDVILEGKGDPDLNLRMDIAEFAESQDLARICWFDTSLKKSFYEILAERRQPFVTFSGRAIYLPPGAFLQATKEGEDILCHTVVSALADADKVVDVFSGCGTFAVTLAGKKSIHAVDSSHDMVEALVKSTNQMTDLRKFTTEIRDLFLRPLLPHELNEFDAAVIDPPRAGAREQVEEIAHSALKKVVMISCNPATFSRDARTLVDAGFEMGRIIPVDQFLYSPHLEVISIFVRK